jgi:hypothetical protein
MACGASLVEITSRIRISFGRQFYKLSLFGVWEGHGFSRAGLGNLPGFSR